jgi:hypothetical protein
MNREDIEKLLGGYAAGVLTPAEEQALFAAALEDQQLFDELAREQPLRDLLRDPSARATLLASLSEERVPWYRRFARPLVAVAAALCIAVPVLVWQMHRPKPQPVLTAQVAEPVKQLENKHAVPAPEPAAPPAAAPAAPRLTASRVPAPAARRVLTPPAVRQLAAEPTPLAKKEAAAEDALKPVENAPSRDVKVMAEQFEVTAQNSQALDGAIQTDEERARKAMQTLRASAANEFRPNQAAGGAAGSLAAPMFATAGAIPQVRWTVLRRQPDGQFTAADAANLQAGDVVKLTFEAPEAGNLYITEQQKPRTLPIEPGKPVEVLMEPQGPGTREIVFSFSRRPILSTVSTGAQPAKAPAPAPAAPVSPPNVITLTYK